MEAGKNARMYPIVRRRVEATRQPQLNGVSRRPINHGVRWITGGEGTTRGAASVRFRRLDADDRSGATKKLS